MTGAGPNRLLKQLLEEARTAEKEQALCYRSLAALAEEHAPDLAQRFHDLHADEQHHLSRLTARLLELGDRPRDLSSIRASPVSLDGWEQRIRVREAAEIERYRRLLDTSLDNETRDLLQGILAVEEHHAADLGGKWTMA